MSELKCPKCFSVNCIPFGPKYRCKDCGFTFIGFHEYQEQALSSLRRFILIIAGIQGGKSEAGAQWIVEEIGKHLQEEGDYLVAAPTYKTLQQSTLGKFLERANIQRLGRFNKQDMVYTLRNGKRVFLRSTEDPNSLEAMTLRAAWLDEVGQMKRQVWINLQGRTAVLEGRIFMTTTPYPDYWWPVNEIISRWKDKDKDYEVVGFDSIENPSFPRREFERARKTLDARVFAMRYRGQYVKMSGLVYPDFGTQNVKECPDTSKIITWLGGIDWGHNFAFGLIGRDKNGTYWKIKEYFAQGGILKEHAEAIKEICKGKMLFGVYYDPSEPGLAQEMTVLFQGMGVLDSLPLIPGNNDVELGISRVGQLIKTRRFLISKSCLNTINEYETYHRKESGEGGEAKIVKVNDHNVDQDRYILNSYPDEELIVPLEEKKDWQYPSEIDRRRAECDKKIKEKIALRERGLVVDSVLGQDW